MDNYDIVMTFFGVTGAFIAALFFWIYWLDAADKKVAEAKVEE